MPNGCGCLLERDGKLLNSSTTPLSQIMQARLSQDSGLQHISTMCGQCFKVLEGMEDMYERDPSAAAPVAWVPEEEAMYTIE